MFRLRRTLTAFAAVASLGIGAAPAHAVSTLTYAFVVDCADADGVRSDEVAPLTFPTGTYAVTITGFCSYGQNRTVTVSTPCSTPAGTVPCADVHNVPQPCQYSTGGVGTDNCGTTLNPPCWAYRVEVDGQCVTFDNVGFIYHAAPGPITARFLDCCYPDNYGAFLVTVTWTPL